MFMESFTISGGIRKSGNRSKEIVRDPSTAPGQAWLAQDDGLKIMRETKFRGEQEAFPNGVWERGELGVTAHLAAKKAVNF
jgi:hypothetical protein